MIRLQYITALLAIAVLAILTPSCKKELALPDVGQQKIVMMGELTADDSIFFRAGQSLAVRAGSSLKFELVQNLKVNVQEGGTIWQLDGSPDDLSPSLYTIPYRSLNMISSGKTYIVTGTHSNLGEAKASVTIPQPFTAHITDTTRVLYQGDSAMRFTIEINDRPELGNNYVIEATQQFFTTEPFFFMNGMWLSQFTHFSSYDSLQQLGLTVPERNDTVYNRSSSRVNINTSDPLSEQIRNGYGSNTRRVLLSDLNFNGSKHTTEIYIPLLVLQYSSGFRTLIQVKSVSEAYFQFLTSYEQYDPTIEFNNTAAPVRIKGNIENGVGIIGGVYRQQFGYFF